ILRGGRHAHTHPRRCRGRTPNCAPSLAHVFTAAHRRKYALPGTSETIPRGLTQDARTLCADYPHHGSDGLLDDPWLVRRGEVVKTPATRFLILVARELEGARVTSRCLSCAVCLEAPQAVEKRLQARPQQPCRQQRCRHKDNEHGVTKSVVAVKDL